jgi:hypothetical protein
MARAEVLFDMSNSDLRASPLWVFLPQARCQLRSVFGRLKTRDLTATIALADRI